MSDFPESGLLGWMLAGVASATAALTSAIAFLYKAVQQGHAERLDSMQKEINILREDQKRLDKLNEECIKDRERLSVEVELLRQQLRGEDV